MPNRRTKKAKIAAKQAAARERDAAARKAELEKEGAQLRAKAAENDSAGKPSILTNLPAMSVRERKLQSQNKGLPTLSGEQLKGRALSKHEILARRRKV
jgi:hypothetical protein